MGNRGSKCHSFPQKGQEGEASGQPQLDLWKEGIVLEIISMQMKQKKVNRSGQQGLTKVKSCLARLIIS